MLAGFLLLISALIVLVTAVISAIPIPKVWFYIPGCCLALMLSKVFILTARYPFETDANRHRFWIW
jgi:hypothetical protein